MPETVSYQDPSNTRPDTYWNGKGQDKGDATFQRVSPATPLGLVGEYLPELEPGEVEIAMIGMHSVMGDVISVRARKTDGLIRYCAVDEAEIGYAADESSQYSCIPETSTEPLTYEELGELLWSLNSGGYRIFAGSWDAERKGSDLPLERDNFFTLSSDFYEGLNEWLDERYEQWRRESDPNSDDGKGQ